MQHKVILLIGPSGSGKSTIANELFHTYGLKPIDSYTTRPPRYSGEPGHIFVSDAEFDRLTGIVAYTEFDGHRYCATAEQIDQCDVYVVDVAGVETLTQRYNGCAKIIPLYLDVPEEICEERMADRGDTQEMIKKRISNDVVLFDSAVDRIASCCGICIRIVNDGDIKDTASAIYQIWQGE